MLDINDSTLASLIREHERREIERLAMVVLTPSGRPIPDDAERQAIIDRAVAKAADYGLEDTRSRGLFAGYWLVLGEHFHMHPACNAILTDPGIPPENRMDGLMHPSFQAVWNEIAARG